MPLDLNKARKCLADFDFSKLFVEELGWSQPASRQAIAITHKDAGFTRRQLAQLSGVMVLEITAKDGQIPGAKTRAALHKEISALHHENLLIFVDERRTQSLWYWVKRQDGKTSARDHIYVRGQPGDLFLSKLNSMVFDLGDFDEAGNVPLVEVADRLKEALDIERVTKKFYGEFQDQHLEFLNLIKGIDDDRDRRWYASVLLNRLMFVYFLQRKFFLDGGEGRYLQNKLEQSREEGRDLYYEKFLKTLFFEGFAKPEDQRSAKVNGLLGKIKYLNGGLFLHHRIELDWPKISIQDKAFANLFALFERYSWNLNDTPGGEDNEINPDVLGYIFEKYINQKAFGAYYTRPEITEYLCERTIHRLILDGVAKGDGKAVRSFDNMGDLLLALDAPLCKKLLYDVLPNLRLLDPACGSAAFLVSAMKTLINVYAAVIGKIEFLSDKGLQEWLKKTQKEHKSVSYFIKRSIITNNLFGVDIMEEAIEIAKLRLFLALVASANSADALEPLPNIEFNIMAGNSLIGLVHVDPAKFDALTGAATEQGRMNMVHKSDLGFAVESKVAKTKKEVEREYAAKVQGRKFAELLAEKNDLVALYRRATGYGEDLQELRDGIEKKKSTAKMMLNRLLLAQFRSLEIQYEEATWDERKNREGKPERRALKEDDIVALKPFHWGYEFDQIINERGGFDAIITNPPWEAFKPNSKQFFEEYSDLVTQKKMTIGEFEKERAKLLKDADTRKAWLAYQSSYPHTNDFFRSAPQYKNQISIVDDKKAAADVNLYKLFTEQCVNLLRRGGHCGIVLPSGIYTDMGTKQLRALLFKETKITGLFCFENRKQIFEGVDSRFKFVVLTYEKGGSTSDFPAAFMRLDASELERFPQEGAISISVELISRLSPDTLSIMELNSVMEVGLAKKLIRFPILGDKSEREWNFAIKREFHIRDDAQLFVTSKRPGALPLLSGKMFHQFQLTDEEPTYWIPEAEGRNALLGNATDTGARLDYQRYRFVYRRIASNTNERTLISTIIPPGFFGEVNTPTLDLSVSRIDPLEMLFLCAALNSFTVDWFIRRKVTTTLNQFYVYQVPVPRLAKTDEALSPIANRTARLICVSREFDELAKCVGLKSHKEGAIDPVERGKLRSELDGLIAHLYGLTEDEFAYILTTFPLVADPVKDAARNAYRDVERGLIK
ncbi:MAG: ATP-binding protein [Candidatus Hydrogenedentes bacterium]|nr:ATP-binding protein [Candidatus Hydrogenedentota bacterium]